MAFINVLHNTRDVVDWINTRCICTASVVLVPREEAAVVSDVARGFAGIEIEIPGLGFLLSIPVLVKIFTAFAAQVSAFDVSTHASLRAAGRSRVADEIAAIAGPAVHLAVRAAKGATSAVEHGWGSVRACALIDWGKSKHKRNTST